MPDYLLPIDPQSILDTIKEAYYNQFGESIQIGSPEFAAASAQAYAWSILINQINEGTKNRLIDTADGEYLDAIAATFGITRPDGYHANALVSFVWNNIYGLPPTVIPAGDIRIEHGGCVFTNTYPLTAYKDGYTYTEFVLYAEDSGSQYNNIPRTAESTVISGSYWFSAFSFETMSGGGSDGFPDTEDGNNAFREWLKIEIQSFAGAGTYQAYLAKAKNSDPRVKDVYVVQQGDTGFEKGKVKIYVYAGPLDDFTPIQAIVKDSCSDPSFRPVCDFVQVIESQPDEISLGVTIQTTYPPQFRGECLERNNRILSKYRNELLEHINKPFCFAELCRRLISTDSQGVYCTDAKPLGLLQSDYLTPIYPQTGDRVDINVDSITWDIQIGGL
jgi:phage-related baseplate assembly protein